MKNTGRVSASGWAVQSAAVGQRERHHRLDQRRVVRGGPDRAGGTLRGADGGHLGHVQVAVEDAGRDAVLGGQVVRRGVDLAAAARVGQGRGDHGEPVRGEMPQQHGDLGW
jgi:hypothetical protein